MALTLGDNFSYQGAKPLDGRLKYDTLAAMKAVADATMYDGCMAYCVEADKTYQWKPTNTVDESTGKWREFSSGGSTGGGHTIEDSEGTSLTQRDTLQFGEGFIAEDDDTNKKTVISLDVMQSGDMSDVITPLPSVQPRYQKYSTEEQIVGEWIDGSPVYQKTFKFKLTALKTEISIGASVEDAFVTYGYVNNGTGYLLPKALYLSGDMYINSGVHKSNNTVYIETNINELIGKDCVLVVQYTKTTD